MVTTRGKRASALVEEPQPSPARKQQRRGEWHQTKANENTTNQASDSRLRKKRSHANDISLAIADQVSKAKRQKTEAPLSSPAHRKSSRSKSPLVTRKQGSKKGISEEALSSQVIQEDAATGSPRSASEDQESVLETGPSSQLEVPTSVLSRKSQPEDLPVVEQFQALLQQDSKINLEQNDVSEVIHQIVEHWESLTSNDSEAAGSTSEVSTKLQSTALPILTQVSRQIIHTFASYDLISLQQAITRPDSDGGRIFSIYQKLLRIVRSLYPLKEGLLVPPRPSSEPPEDNISFTLANLAAFLNGCFGTDDLGFHTLHEQFRSIFQRIQGVDLRDKFRLLLDLKTQAYVSTICSHERAKDLVLAEMFSPDMASQIDTSTVEATDSLAEVKAFEVEMRTRKHFLESHINTDDEIPVLNDRFPFVEFLQELTNFCNHYFEVIAQQPLSSIAPLCDNINSMHFRSAKQVHIQSKNSANTGGSTGTTNSMNNHPAIGSESQSSLDSIHIQRPRYNPPAHQQPTPRSEEADYKNETSPVLADPAPPDDIVAQAAKAAEEALLGFSQSNGQDALEQQKHAVDGSPAHDQSQMPTPLILEGRDSHTITNPAQPYLQTHHQPSQPQTRPIHYPPNAIPSLYGPPPGQTQPTAVLYERARQVANSKSSNVSRSKTVSVSQRRPWSIEEEQALMDGLDQVKGPHWSQILVLYGPGGTINETLRDRTQVQLKDKARNLKLFFLKSKIEVPYYLSFVTGELKSRAPSHASALDDTPSRPATVSQNGQVNGNGTSTSSTPGSRNRPPVAIAQPASTMMLSHILQFPRSNGTYCSPYPPIDDAAKEFSSIGSDNSLDIEDTTQQDVADLATSAAAQVAAALANFNSMELPGLDLSGSLSAKIDALEDVGTASAVLSETGSQDVENDGNEAADLDPEENLDNRQYLDSIARGTLPESIEAFDAH